MINVFLICLACCCSSLMPLKLSDSIVCEDHIQVVEEKVKKNYSSDFGYIVMSITDLADNQFISNMIDVYPSGSIIYDPPYTNFTFSVLNDIFTASRLVTWQQLNASTDFGYSVGVPITDVYYKFISSGSSNFNTYHIYEVYAITDSSVSCSCRFSMISYNSSSVQNYGFICVDISSTSGSDTFFIITPDSATNNLSKVLYNDNNVEYQRGYTNGYYEGQEKGYNVGYGEGITYAQEQSSTALTIFTGIIEVGLLPVNVFLKMFEYEVFGINIAGFVSALLTIALVVIIIRVVTGKKND